MQYTFGYHSCLHRETEDFALFLGSSIVVQIVCAYITLPLYALMGSSMKEAIFSEQVVAGLKHWHNMAKKNVSTKESINSPASPSATPSMNSDPQVHRPSIVLSHR
ncbi:hypothetical protein HPP92_021663 [Vanilla planifolia]|uniref:Uncharacterized protein n=1 Tax=Vanilla planifolia TaxID=51239 RepID=A0A835UJ75_VANPL|nr:hypothetical protein HPP92_021663 [Vanilla planifolia]